MSIKPPIKCPPDYSILAFRITECKKAGIVKGIETQLSVDLQKLFVPVTNYEERSMTLKAGEIKKIDVSSLGVQWPLNEKFAFIANADFCGDGTSHSYSLYDVDLNLIETISFTVDENSEPFIDFQTALSTAISGSTKIKNLVSFDASQFVGPNSPLFVTASKRGVKYRHVFSFDLDGFGGYLPFPFVHPGNLLVPYLKYERPRVKIMLIYPDYYKANVLSSCGCLDASGDMKSNKKYIEYAFEEDYFRIKNPGSPITANPILNNANASVNWTWNQSSPDHIGYHFAKGDLIKASGNNLRRGLVKEMDGYFFSTDIAIGDSFPALTQTLSHVWSPSVVTWRNMGDFYLHTTAQDITDTDKLYIESLWLKNPHDYDLPIKIMLAS